MSESGSARSARDAVTEWAFAAGWRLVRMLPERAAYGAFDRAADVIWRRRGGGVIQFERNQARIHPDATVEDLKHLSRQGLRSYMRYWCDAFRLPTWSPERVRSTFVLERVELLDDAVRSGRGALMVVNHGGNWDHAGAWACLRYGGLTTVAERLKPEGLYQQFVDYRESLGMEILPLGEADVVRSLARRLKEGRLVPLLGDRDISRNGVVVDFFGEPASLPAGPALLGMLTGASIHPVTLRYEGPLAVGTVGDRVPVPASGTRQERIQAVTQAIARGFEAGIRRSSADWHMMQPVWLADLDAERRQRGTQAEVTS